MKNKTVIALLIITMLFGVSACGKKQGMTQKEIKEAFSYNQEEEADTRDDGRVEIKDDTEDTEEETDDSDTDSEDTEDNTEEDTSTDTDESIDEDLAKIQKKHHRKRTIPEELKNITIEEVMAMESFEGVTKEDEGY